jgi:hypothetical protein
MNTITHVLYSENIEVFRGTDFECHYKLQRFQGQSAHYAMKYGGWKIAPVEESLSIPQLYDKVEKAKSIMSEIVRRNPTTETAMPARFYSVQNAMNKYRGIMNTKLNQEANRN